MLNIVNLKSGYNNAVEIIHGVNLTIQPGEIIALIGPNGAGKSTIMKSIFNLAMVYSGQIIFKDTDITKLKTHELIDLGICYVPQGRQIFSSMTILENLQMGAFTIKNRDLVKKNIHHVFHKFPLLKERQNDFASNLSGGQQQLLVIARALIQDPQIMLLDEPSLGLDPKTMEDIFKKIVEIKNEGVSILMVEQNARQAIAIADKTYVLENGKIALEGGNEIIKNKKISDIYLGGN